MKQSGTKRKRAGKSNNRNPLSDARRPKETTSSKSTKQLQVESLWHRKTGAGFALFVSFYGEQPPGVVASGGEVKASGKVSQFQKPSPAREKGAGLSRASLRRKKKKKKNGADVEKSCLSKPQIANTEDHAPEPPTPTLPLFQALEVTSKNYMHTVPFLEALSKPLPLTFRLRQHFGTSDNSEFQQELKKLLIDLSLHSDLISPATYDPTQQIYQATHPELSKQSLSKLSSSLKTLLVKYSTNGMVARQELGSMLPVLALHGGNWLKRGSRILDMCASPGSKTLQSLELVAATQSNQDQISARSKSKLGRLVANDVHPSRLQALEEAINRSGIPQSLISRVTYTNFDASRFPYPKSGKLFDAIIADVPCSGDGTIRKDAHILPNWTPSTSNALHSLQVRILSRALELVKVGGVVCYSTCSLNPIEDEAVVAAALRETQKQKKTGDAKRRTETEECSATEIMEWPSEILPGLTRRSGVASWRVADYTGEEDIGKRDDHANADAPMLRWHRTYEDAVGSGMVDAEPTMWPTEANEQLHLERCTRLWPQDNDSGGFFVALLKRKN